MFRLKSLTFIFGFGILYICLRHIRILLSIPSDATINKLRTTKRDAATKLFLYAYMKGGSTILGELFNCDPSASMWYEPGSAFFCSYYGFAQNNVPQTTLHFRNHTRRYFDLDWQLAHTHFYTNIFSCNYHLLPPQAMAHDFIRQSSAMADYLSCRWTTEFPQEVNSCAELLAGHCSSNFVELAEPNECHEYISMTSFFFHHGGHTTFDALVDAWIQYNANRGIPADEANKLIPKIKQFVQYELCVQEMRRRNEQCLNLAVAKCLTDSLTVVQVIRIKMEDLEPIIRLNPDLRVVYYVRDPRAIALSRSMVDRRSDQSVQHAKFLCRRMREDLKQKRRLELQYPDIFIEIKYENLILNPVRTAQRIYSAFGATAPARWSSYASRNMRPQSVTKWRRVLSQSDIQQINSMCSDVILQLGYSL